MYERQPSRTALGAAGYRAAHQLLEGGKVFSDPLARTILGDGADAIIAGLSASPAHRGMRLFMAARSRSRQADSSVVVPSDIVGGSRGLCASTPDFSRSADGRKKTRGA